MPTSPFFEVSPVQRHIGPPADASTYTKMVRQAATIAPYINNRVTGAGAPTLGWKSPALATEMRVIAPIFGQLNAFFPNRK
jgi:hypothetical protein